MQYDGEAEHTPFRQAFEQQSASTLQGFGDVLQAGFNGVQVPAPPSLRSQLPLQHWLLAVQGCRSATQALAPHLPESQTPRQQSIALSQASPAPRHAPPEVAHTPRAALQWAEQQATLDAPGAPTWAQAPAAPPVAPAPPPL